MIEHPYGYKPRPVFFGEGSAFLGIELEVVAPSYSAKNEGLRTAGEPTWCYAKCDGSIGSTGTEIVTHPISVNFWMSRTDTREYTDYHNLTPGQVLTGRYKGATYTATVHTDGKQVVYNGRRFRSISAAAKEICNGTSQNGYRFFGLIRDHQPNPVGNFFRLVEALRRLSYTSHDDGRCGFHIHVSRTAFSESGDLRNSMFYRFKCLINGLLFRKLSQRSTFEYCQQEPVDPHWFHERNWNRRMAVNITEKTVEVRLFRGNTREKRIRKNIEAVIAALEFGRDTARMEAPTDDEFVNYVRGQSYRFPNLVEYINELEARERQPTPAPTEPTQGDDVVEVIDLTEEGGA